MIFAQGSHRLKIDAVTRCGCTLCTRTLRERERERTDREASIRGAHRDGCALVDDFRRPMAV